MSHMRALLRIPALTAARQKDGASGFTTALKSAAEYLGDRPDRWAALLGWVLVRSLGAVADPDQPAPHSRAWFDEWLLGRTLHRACIEHGLDDGAATMATGLARTLVTQERALRSGEEKRTPRQAVEALLRDGDVVDFLCVNRYRDVLWFNEERFDELFGALLAAAATLVVADPNIGRDEAGRELAAQVGLVEAVQKAARQSDFQVDKLLRGLPATEGAVGKPAASAPARPSR
jgi:hypothetical protein